MRARNGASSYTHSFYSCSIVPPSQLPVLLRIEVNPNDPSNYRITVACSDQNVAQATRDTIVSVL